MAALTFLDKKAKFADAQRNRLSANTWQLRYGGTVLKLNPKVDDQGMVQRPGISDVEYCHTLEAWIGHYAKLEQRIPDAAFEEGAEWEAYNTRATTKAWIKWVIDRPVEQDGMWLKVTFTPSLLT